MIDMGHDTRSGYMMVVVVVVVAVVLGIVLLATTNSTTTPTTTSRNTLTTAFLRKHPKKKETKTQRLSSPPPSSSLLLEQVPLEPCLCIPSRQAEKGAKTPTTVDMGHRKPHDDTHPLPTTFAQTVAHDGPPPDDSRGEVMVTK